MSDGLAEASRLDFNQELMSYCKRHADSLWQFGLYNKGNISSNNPPLLDDLTANVELWSFHLKWFPHGRLTESVFDLDSKPGTPQPQQ